jgi:enediyne biosynthesis protein E4
MTTLRLLLPLLLICISSCRRSPEPLFRDVAEESGLVFQHVPGLSGKFYLPEIMGSGVALLDYDLDGDIDVYLVQGPAESGNRLFRNDLVPSGKLRFTDVTTIAGVGHKGYGMGAAVGDYDNDGDADLFVTNFGPNVLYRNNGDGTFADVSRQAGIDEPRWSTSAAFVDYDRDGKLDLFAGSYLNYSIAANKSCVAPTGEQDYCNPSVYQGLPSRLFRNNGDGTFLDVTTPSGIGSAIGKALGVVCFDYDRDGWIDIYVANDGVGNHLWHNSGGVFKEVALPAGVAYSADGKAQAGMGVDAGDFDNNGTDDIFVTNLAHETNNLYRNDGKGNFADAILQSGMGPASEMYTGFGVRFFDFDHDGRLDLFVANGAVTRVEAQRGSAYPFRQPNQLFRNSGARFEEAIRFVPEEVSRGAAFGDVDNDGDIDVVVSNNNGPARLFLNVAGSRAPSLQIRLEGSRSNRQGLGARVALVKQDTPVLWRRVQTDGSYLSASDSRVHFGLSGCSDCSDILVYWPDGSSERWPKPPTSKFVTLRQGTGSATH